MPGPVGAAGAGAGAGAAGAAGADAGANAGSEGADAVDLETGEIGENGEKKPAKKVAKVDDDPDFEWEEPDEKDAKAPPKKYKIKTSEAKKRLSAYQKEKASLAADRAAIQRHHDEQISPLEKTIKELQEDPRKLLELSRRLGVDPRKAMEELAREELKLLNMTPEQRRVYELEQEISRRDASENERTTKAKAEHEAQESRKVQERIVGGILKAASDAKLPKHSMVLSLMSAFLRAQVNNGQDPDPNVAAEAVRDFAMDYTKSSIANLTYDQIVDTFPDVVKKIREGDSGKVVDQHVPRTAPARKPEAKVKRAMTPAEFTAKMMRGE